jgi:hypothetical protein
VSRVMRYQLGWIGLARDPARRFTEYAGGRIAMRWVRLIGPLWVRVR